MENCLNPCPTFGMTFPCFRSLSSTHGAGFGEGIELDQELLLSHQEQVPVPSYHLTPGQTHLTQLTEERQIRTVHRMGLYSISPEEFMTLEKMGQRKGSGVCDLHDGLFFMGTPFDPCMHMDHLDCIDEWSMDPSHACLHGAS